MAKSDFFKKTFSYIFNMDQPVRALLVSLALSVPVTGGTYHLIKEEVDIQRTPVAGARQFAHLQKELKTITAMKQALGDLEVTAKEHQRDVSFEIADTEQRYAMARIDFKNALLRNTTISEADAGSLIGEFQRAVGDQTFAEISPGQAAYLHECQTGSGAIEECLQKKQAAEITASAAFALFSMCSLGTLVFPRVGQSYRKERVGEEEGSPKKNPPPQKQKQKKFVITLRNE